MGRFGSPENPVFMEVSGIIWSRSWVISVLELEGELEASRSSLGRGLGVSLLSPVKSKHLVEPSVSSPPSGERRFEACLGELDTRPTGDPTVRFSLEVVEEDKLSDRNRLELLGSKTLKGKTSSDLSIQ